MGPLLDLILLRRALRKDNGPDWTSTAHVERAPFHRGGSVSREDLPGRYSSLSPSTTGCRAAQRAGQ